LMCLFAEFNLRNTQLFQLVKLDFEDDSDPNVCYSYDT